MATATLVWTPPAKRADGAALAPDQIAAAHVFDDLAEIGVAPGAAGTFVTGALAPGVHTFTVVTHDKAGAASAPSNAAAVTVPEAAPAAIADLAAALTP